MGCPSWVLFNPHHSLSEVASVAGAHVCFWAWSIMSSETCCMARWSEWRNKEKRKCGAPVLLALGRARTFLRFGYRGDATRRPTTDLTCSSLYHTPLPHRSPISFCHIPLPHRSPIPLSHIPLPYPSATSLYHIALPYPSITAVPLSLNLPPSRFPFNTNRKLEQCDLYFEHKLPAHCSDVRHEHALQFNLGLFLFWSLTYLTL